MLKNMFKEVIKNLETNMENKKDLLYTKTQITELTMQYIDEIENLESAYKKKILMFENRLSDLESAMQKLENETFEDSDEEVEADLEPIKCPYCNTNFFIEFDSTKKEIKCPDCKNIIELDWGNFEDDM